MSAYGSGYKSLEPLRCHIVVNGSAGSVQRDRVADTLKIGLPQLSPTLHHPTSVAELQDLIRGIPIDEDLVIGGGDGTLQCAVPALMETQRPVVILPLGTANDFARHWGFTPDLLSLYYSLSRRVVKQVDVIQCNEVYFVTVGGLGVGAFLTRDFNFLRKQSRLLKRASQLAGTNIYTGLAAATILGRRSYLREYEIETDTEVRSGMFSNVFVCNQPRLGGDLVVSPRAIANDGLFDVLFLRGRTPQELMLSLASLRFHGEPKLSERVRIKSMKIRARDGRENLLFADGEAFQMKSELNFSVHHGALKILTAGDTVA